MAVIKLQGAIKTNVIIIMGFKRVQEKEDDCKVGIDVVHDRSDCGCDVVADCHGDADQDDEGSNDDTDDDVGVC